MVWSTVAASRTLRPAFTYHSLPSVRLHIVDERLQGRGRMVATVGRAGLAEDVGPVVGGLLSDASGWVSGRRIEVAGGVHL